MKLTLRKRKWLLITLIATTLLIGSGCRPAAERAGAQETSSETVTAFVGDLLASTGATGKVVALRAADVALAGGGTVVELPIAVGDQVAAGDLLVRLDDATLRRAVAQAEQDVLSLAAALADLETPPTPAELAAAEAAVTAAKTRLDKLRNGPTADEITAGEAGVRAAEANVWAAVNRLNAAVEGASDAEVRAAQLEVDAAQKQYDEAHATYVALADCKPNDSGSHDCTFDRDQDGGDEVYFGAAAALADLERAQAILSTLQNGNPHNIAVAQAGVSVAAAQRDAAQARLELLLAGPTDAEIASAAADLAQAEARLIDLEDGPRAEQVARAAA